HRHVSPNRRKRRQQPERFGCVPARQQQIQVQLREQHSIPQVVTPGQHRQQLSKLADLEFAKMNRCGLKIKRRAVRASRVSESPQPKLLKKFFEQPFQIVDIELRLT